jgi:hypothetical protein
VAVFWQSPLLYLMPLGQTPIAEGQRIHYNFVKPHMALDGKTPPQASEISMKLENKWLALIRKSKKKS